MITPIHAQYANPKGQPGARTLTLQQAQRKYEQRRMRVARRAFKKAPLFAVELVRQEFPDYTQEQLEKDLVRRTKYKSIRHPKSPLKRMGRYEKMRKEIHYWEETGDIRHLERAQRLKNDLFKPLWVRWTMPDKETVHLFTFPPETNYQVIEQISKLEFSTEEEFWEKIKPLLFFERKHIETFKKSQLVTNKNLFR